MSRTYRLRHERSRVAHRFVDGRVRGYTGSVEDFWADIIVRGIYGYSDVPENHTVAGEEVRPIFGYLAQMLVSWGGAARAIDGIAGDRKFAIANVGCHEYARSQTSATKAWIRKPKRSRKLRNQRILAKATRQGSFDGDWDVGIDQRARGTYA